MNTSGDAAEQIVRLSLEGFEVTAKICGEGAKDIGILLYTLLKDKKRTSGKTTLTNMLKSGKELKVFSVKADEFTKFTQEAKRYGVLYSALIDKKIKNYDGMIDIMVRAEDAPKINRIVERFELSSYNKADIKNSIERGVQTKSKVELIKDQEKDLPIRKDGQILNPHLAKTEKSPLSEPSLETQKTSEVGTKTIDKPSVRKELDKIKKEVEIRDSKERTPQVTKKKEKVK